MIALHRSALAILDCSCLRCPPSLSVRPFNAPPHRYSRRAPMKCDAMASFNYCRPLEGGAMDDDLKGLEILLVEDSEVVGDAVKQLLELLGAKVNGPAVTVAEATTLLGQRLPQVALVDFHLRGGDSSTLIAQLRDQGMPVIILSSEGSTRTRSPLRNSCCAYCSTKPGKSVFNRLSAVSSAAVTVVPTLQSRTKRQPPGCTKVLTRPFSPKSQTSLLRRMQSARWGRVPSVNLALRRQRIIPAKAAVDRVRNRPLLTWGHLFAPSSAT